MQISSSIIQPRLTPNGEGSPWNGYPVVAALKKPTTLSAQSSLPRKRSTDMSQPETFLCDLAESCELGRNGDRCLKRVDFEKIVREMPKLQLHDHLEGSVRPQTILDEAARLGVPKPAATLDDMRDLVAMCPGEDLLDFLKKFDSFRFVFEDANAIKRIAYEAVEDNHKDGVDYVELRMNCQKNPDVLSVGEVMDAALDGMECGSEEFGVECRFIASINRSYSAEDAMKIAEAAVARMERGVVGLDLAGDEINHPPGKFTEVFAYARDHGLKVTVHAGEAMGPQSIEAAVDELGADRIGHGTRLLEDERLMARILEEDIHLEMCPHSNVLLNVVDGMKGYPIRDYHDVGISTSLNTDDKHIFDIDLVDEYMAMVEHNGFSLEELQKMNLRALEHAFLPLVDKTRLIEQFRAEYDSINSGLTDKTADRPVAALAA